MKVLQVIDKLDAGGSERVAVDMSILLSKSNEIQISFLCLLSPSVLDKELQENGITVHYLYRKNKFNPTTVLKMLSVFNKYDIVHIHSRQVLRYVGLLYLFPIKRKFKLLFHDHYGDIETDTSYSKYLKFCLKKPAAYIGVSHKLTDWAKSNSLNKKVFKLSNIIRRQSNIKKLDSQSTIVVVGNFRPQKNYEFLCNLLSKLPNSITVDLYGNISDIIYYEKIISLIKQLNIKDRIRIFTGKTDVSSLFENYKLALHCAASESGPLVAIEYASKGIPVILFNTGEVVKILDDNNYELILNNFNFKIWINKINDLLENETKRKQVSKDLLNIYNANFSEEEYLNKCLSIYHQIL